MSDMRFLIHALAVSALVAVGQPARGQPRCLVADRELQASYKGGCVDGKAEGQGAATGIATYTGEFHLGKKHGKGVKTWARGDRYEGGFVDDYMEGWGVYTWGTKSLFAGDRYEGQFTRDKRNGFGLYVWGSGASYAGLWTDDVVAGLATPMMINRFRATNAHVEAMEKPGTRVCHESAIGTGAPRTEAEVQSVDKNARQVSVRISRVGSSPVLVAGSAVTAGEVVSDDPLHWIPCN